MVYFYVLRPYVDGEVARRKLAEANDPSRRRALDEKRAAAIADRQASLDKAAKERPPPPRPKPKPKPKPKAPAAFGGGGGGPLMGHRGGGSSYQRRTRGRAGPAAAAARLGPAARGATPKHANGRAPGPMTARPATPRPAPDKGISKCKSCILPFERRVPRPVTRASTRARPRPDRAEEAEVRPDRAAAGWWR